jgi:hypothetical protein
MSGLSPEGANDFDGSFRLFRYFHEIRIEKRTKKAGVANGE